MNTPIRACVAALTIATAAGCNGGQNATTAKASGLSEPAPGQSQAADTAPKLVLVTLDGFRWQELFRGADTVLAGNEAYVSRKESTRTRFLDPEKRAIALTPFLHEVVGQQGVLIGNRDAGSCAEVTNPWWFSYPGYNEILTGHADPAIDSNDKNDNPNVTFLEWLNGQPAFKGKVVAFGSWDAFPAIINETRSGVPVNAGFEPLAVQDPAMQFLDKLLAESPSPWDTERLDAFTHEYALWTLRNQHPRVTYISFGETDEFAHEGHYDMYLDAAHRADGFLRELWQTLQADPYYADHTTLIVTTDHGRGDASDESWRHHASPAAMQGPMKDYAAHFPLGIHGSNQTWIAVLGPGLQREAEQQYREGQCAHNAQVAAAALRALGQDPEQYSEQAEPALAVLP